MAAFSEYLINESDSAEVYLYWDCKYILKSEVILPAEQIESWCYSCNMLVAAELIPSLAEIDARIRDLDNPDNIILKCFSRAALERERVELPIRHAWRALRQSPPRCLHCGSADIFAITGNDCIEPRFQIRFHVVAGGHASMCFEIVRRLSPEGMVVYSNDPEKNITFH